MTPELKQIEERITKATELYKELAKEKANHLWSSYPKKDSSLRADLSRQMTQLNSTLERLMRLRNQLRRRLGSGKAT